MADGKQLGRAAVTFNGSVVGLAKGIKEAKKAVDNFSEAIRATTKKQRKGVSKPIPFLGHKYPKRNPALNAWKAGVACHKDWKPEGGKLSVEWLYDTFYVREETQRLKEEAARRADQSAQDKKKYMNKKAMAKT